MDARAQLQEMGFSAGLIEAALRNTSGNLEEAVQWIETNQDLQNDVGETETTADAGEAPHEEEQKPLTEEEKEAKLAALRARADERKKQKAKEDLAESRRNDDIRRKREKDRAQIVDDMQQKQAKKEAEKKRKEMAEDALAKKRIRDQIEEDKRARKAEREQRASGQVSEQKPAYRSPPAPSAPRADLKTSKIRFRLPNSPEPLTKEYDIDEKVDTVLEDAARASGLSKDKVQLKMTFPTRIVDSKDSDKGLKEAGLVNTNVIVA